MNHSITIQESKKIYYDFISKKCENFKSIRYLFNDMYIVMKDSRYFTLKFTNEEVELFEREYINSQKITSKLYSFPLDPTENQLLFMRDKYLE